VSRQTVTRALSALAQRRLLVRRRGIGTFVAERPVDQPLDRLYSFVRTLAVDGQPPSTRLLGARLTAEPEAARLLGQPEGELLFEVSRLFVIEGMPFAYERIYLTAAVGERLPADRLAGAVMYELLRECCGLEVTHGEETLRVAALSRGDAALMHLKPGEATLLIERVTYAGDEIVEARRTVVRADRTRFRVRLAGPHLTPLVGEAG
jgi:GntR family transcriptional regulator